MGWGETHGETIWGGNDPMSGDPGRADPMTAYFIHSCELRARDSRDDDRERGHVHGLVPAARPDLPQAAVPGPSAVGGGLSAAGSTEPMRHAPRAAIAPAPARPHALRGGGEGGGGGGAAAVRRGL
eukprot:scaffold33088_cov40-Phaeocystis_antarctica.AAC.2